MFLFALLSFTHTHRLLLIVLVRMALPFVLNSSLLLEYALMVTALIPFNSPILDLTVPMENCNFQEEYYTCEDSNGGPPADAEVLIACVDLAADTVFSSNTVIEGRNVTVSEDRGLHDSIRCSVTSTNEMILYQEVTLNTSGDVNLLLGNKFGGLQLQASDDQDCIECIKWIYTFDNIGSTPMTITVVDHTFNGITDSLIDQLPTTDLAVAWRVNGHK